MRAVPVTPRQVMFTVCGQCPSLHAEGLKTLSILMIFMFSPRFNNLRLVGLQRYIGKRCGVCDGWLHKE